MSQNNLHVVWAGRFKVGIGERKDLTLEFNAPDSDTALHMVSVYISTKVDKSWVLEDYKINITYNH